MLQWKLWHICQCRHDYIFSYLFPMKLVANVIFLSFALLDISWDEWCNYIHRSAEMKISIRMLINCFKTRLPTWRQASFIRWTLANLICCFVKLDLSFSFWLQIVDIYANWWDIFYFFFWNIKDKNITILGRHLNVKHTENICWYVFSFAFVIYFKIGNYQRRIPVTQKFMVTFLIIQYRNCFQLLFKF